MRELRVQHKGRPLRVLYAFDPKRTAILLIGGDKTGDERWYDVNVPLADEIYERHIAALKKEGLIEDGSVIQDTEGEDVARGARARTPEG